MDLVFTISWPGVVPKIFAGQIGKGHCATAILALTSNVNGHSVVTNFFRLCPVPTELGRLQRVWNQPSALEAKMAASPVACR